jgi:hypothetical protein
MDVTAEAIEKMQEVVEEARGFQVEQPAGEPGDVYWLCHPKMEKPERRVCEPAPRKYRTETLEAFIWAIAAFKGDRSVVIFYAHGRFDAVFDEGKTRRERIWMAWQESSAFLKLEQLAGARQHLPQKEFVNLLRLELYGAVKDETVHLIRNLEFKKSTEGHARVEQGKESLGQKIEREVSMAGGPVPSEMTLSLPVYDDYPGRCDEVICGVDVDVESGSFALIPVAGELSKARREADAEICKKLEEAKIADYVVQGRFRNEG